MHRTVFTANAGEMTEAVQMKSRRPRSTRRNARSARKIGRPLDAVAREALERCAWVIAECGYSPEESAREFRSHCTQIPSSVIRQGLAANPDFDLSAHLLTLWSQDRKYLLPNGELRPLPARGPAPSIETLVRALDKNLTVDEAIDSLNASKALRRRGTKYIPRDSWVVAYPSNSVPQLAHHMWALVEFLRTLQHNTRARSKAERWFQYAALNPYVPARQFAAIKRYLRKTGMAFLKDKDALMHRMARDRKTGEPTIPISIGVYLSTPSVPKGKRLSRAGKIK